MLTRFCLFHLSTFLTSAGPPGPNNDSGRSRRIGLAFGLALGSPPPDRFISTFPVFNKY